jgi:predicted HicB family RNase H-like nuclease
MGVRKRLEQYIALEQKRRPSSGTAVVSVRMPRGLHERLAATKAAERVSMNRFCVMAIEDALEQLGAGSVAPAGGQGSPGGE